MPIGSLPGWRRIARCTAALVLAIGLFGGGALAAEREHVVRRGETLWDLADRYLGSGLGWSRIYEANRDRMADGPRTLQIGTRLTIPGSTRVSARYRVKRGDSLWRISERHLGAGHKWRRIYEPNRGVIGADPRLIRPGTVLALGPAAVTAGAAGHRRVAGIKRPRPVAEAPAPRPAAKPVAKAPAKPVVKAPAKPVVKAPAKPVVKAPAKPAARPLARSTPARNPFDYRPAGAPAAAPGEPAAVVPEGPTPPGRNPFSFGGQRGKPVVPPYPEDGAVAGPKGKPPVAVDVKGGKPVAKQRKKKHLAQSPKPRIR